MTREPKKKSFPQLCLSCGARAINPATISYSLPVKHDGRVHEVAIKAFRVPRCDSCHELVMGVEADEQIDAALRQHLGLLRPDEIKAHRQSLGLTQKQLAAVLGVAEESLCRWETGTVVQSRSTDNLLRLCFEVPQARTYLSNRTA